MNGKEYSGSSLEQCLSMAEKDLQLERKYFQYEVIEKKKSFFGKKVKILVEAIENTNENTNEDINENTNTNEDINENTNHGGSIDNITMEDMENELNGKIKVCNGKIIVSNPKEGGKPALIAPGKNINLTIDGEEVHRKIEVYESSNIIVSFKEQTAQRVLDIQVRDGNMEAYVDIRYIPENSYTLIDKTEREYVALEAKIGEQKFPPKFTSQELKEELYKNGVKNGIIEENFKKCCEEEEVHNFLIAKGKKGRDGIDESLELKFEQNNNKLVEDNTGTIDYKAIGQIKSVKKGTILAIKHVGDEPQDGIDITGKVTKYKQGKKLKLKVGEGCEIKEDNTIIATADGKPSFKGGLISVAKIHELSSNVDLSTGNIKFNGIIKIHGAVVEGMKVEGGDAIEIDKNVAGAEVLSRKDILVRGNIIQSKIIGGKNDAINLKYIKDLNEIKDALGEVIEAVVQVKDLNLYGKAIKDGELIKILIESKFKNIPIIVQKLLLDTLELEGVQDTLILSLKKKLMGFGPLSIENYSELKTLEETVSDKVEEVSIELTIPSNVNIYYCQDSVIKSSGNINILGKGEYVSTITAFDSIYFSGPNCIARGGIIKAKNEIKCKSVGSAGGVSTQLTVERTGHIWAEVAYQNTKFKVGTQEYTLENPSKNVHAYLDSKGDLTVDKLIL